MSFANMASEMRKLTSITDRIMQSWDTKEPLIIGTVTEEGIPFAYTIGLPLLCKCPEIVITGLAINQSYAILQNVFKALQSNSLLVPLLKDEKEVVLKGDDIALNVNLKCRTVKTPEKHMVQAIHSLPAKIVMNQLPGFGSAKQLVWPDKDGNFVLQEGRQFEA